MTFTNIAFKNFKKNINKYIIYLISISFCVFSIFSLLNLSFSEVILNKIETSNNYKTAFQSFAIVITVFTVFFLWYSEKHFIKSRKKEIATYSLCGMPHSKIGRMIIIENLIMFIISIIAGILTGVLFSKLLTMILFNLIGQYAEVPFTISFNAVLYTILLSLSVYILVGIRGYFLVFKYKLIELFKANKEGEKHAKGNKILFIISIVVLGYGYYLAAFKPRFELMSFAITILILTISGTFLFFISGLPIAINIIKKNSKYYFKGYNLLTWSNFYSKIRSNAIMLATISVVSAVALTALASNYSVFYRAEYFAHHLSPFHLSYMSDPDLDNKINEVFNNNEKHSITDDVYVDIYYSNIILEGSTGNLYDEKFEGSILSESKFNSLLLAQGKEPLPSLKSNEDTYFINYYYAQDMEEIINNSTVKVDNYNKSLNITSYKPIIYIGHNFYLPTIILKDEVYENLLSDNILEHRYKVRNLNYSHHKISDKFVSNLRNTLYNEEAAHTLFINHYEADLNLFGTMLFIGIFLGLVFFLATASLLYFRQISNAEPEKEYYNAIRKIGANKNTIKKLVSKQILPFYIIPLLFGITHSSFAMKSASTILQVNFIKPAIIMFAVYIAIYMIFYKITVNQYFKIINNR